MLQLPHNKRHFDPAQAVEVAEGTGGPPAAPVPPGRPALLGDLAMVPPALLLAVVAQGGPVGADQALALAGALMPLLAAAAVLSAAIDGRTPGLRRPALIGTALGGVMVLLPLAGFPPAVPGAALVFALLYAFASAALAQARPPAPRYALPPDPGVLGRDDLADALQGGGAAYAGRVVMITGAGGSIGGELCRQVLACRPRALILVDVSEYALFSIERSLSCAASGDTPRVVPVLGSVTDPILMRAVIREHGVQVILHAAAYKHVPMVERNPLAGIVNNVFGTLTLAQAAADLGVARFVLVSTDKAVRPQGVMGASKRMAEIVIGDLARRSTATVFAKVRFGNVLESSGSVVPIFREQIRRGGPVALTAPDVTRYFMTIPEACRLVLWSGTLARGGEIFVLDMGAAVRIADLARQVIAGSGLTVRDAAHPGGDIEIVTTGLRCGEKLHEELSITGDLAPTAHPKLRCARETVLTEFEVARALQGLRAAIDRGEATALVAELMHWVERDIATNAIDPAQGCEA